MKKVGIYEAKTSLSRLLRDVRRGDEVLILDRGTPVAKIVRVEAEEPADAVALFQDLRSRAKPVSQKEIRRWIDTGRK